MQNRIKQIRTEAGLSQAAFASRLNLSRNFVSLTENGDRKVSDRTIIDICIEFNIREEWLRTGEGEKKIPDDEISDVVIANLSESNSLTARMIKATYETYMSLDDTQKAVIDKLLEETLKKLNAE